MRSIVSATAVAFILTVSGATWAQVIQEGQRYQGPVKLESPETGVSLLLPKGWIGVLPAGSDTLMVGNGSNDGNVRVMVHALGRQEAIGAMSQVMTLDDGTVLQPKGQVTANGNLITGEYIAIQLFRRYDAYMAAQVGTSGQTVAVLTVFQPAGRKTFPEIALQLARSAGFKKPVTVSATAGGAGDFFANLVDRKITRYYRASGYSETTEYTLCGNGSFYRKFDGGQRENTAGYSYTMSADARHSGNWRVSGSQLVLQYRDGDRAVYNLSMRNGNELYMDGKRWYRERVQCN
jgi:hypothetical protein